MTSIWFPNNKYPPNTKNYLPCFVLGGGVSIRRKGLYIYIMYIYIYYIMLYPIYFIIVSHHAYAFQHLPTFLVFLQPLLNSAAQSMTTSMSISKLMGRSVRRPNSPIKSPGFSPSRIHRSIVDRAWGTHQCLEICLKIWE